MSELEKKQAEAKEGINKFLKQVDHEKTYTKGKVEYERPKKFKPKRDRLGLITQRILIGDNDDYETGRQLHEQRKGFEKLKSRYGMGTSC